MADTAGTHQQPLPMHRRPRNHVTAPARRSDRHVHAWLLVVLGALAPWHPGAAAEGFPLSAPQGSLIRARVAPQARVQFAGRALRVGPRSEIAFGIGRDERGPATVTIDSPDGGHERISIEVTPRDWPIERVKGVPPASVEPPPEIAARIAREQARVSTARERDDAREDCFSAFDWPARGRLSGRLGNQRVYVLKGKDVPKAPHSGMDIALPEGTPVHAPAGGIVSFADPDLYLTGGTVLIDHGHGVSSNFLHLSRIDVRLGQRVERGEVLGAVGHTGRASGPHLHWGLNWFDVRLDPLLLLDDATRPTAASR